VSIIPSVLSRLGAQKPTSVVIFAVLWLLLTVQFQTNPLGVAPESIFTGWQLNGQARVLGGIVADTHEMDKGGARLGKVYSVEDAPAEVTEEYTATATYEAFTDYPAGKAVIFVPYVTQFGLQEIAYSALARGFALTRLEQLQLAPSLLTAACIALLFMCYRRIYNLTFAVLFVACLAFSPYFLTMARNLYWSPFLFFLPSIAATWAYLDPRPSRRWFYLAMVAVAMALKSLSNYEYITTVTVLACSVFLVAPLFRKDEPSGPQFGWAFAVGMACVVGFLMAFLIHAGTRGDTLLMGIENIYIEDIARRTYGDPSLYDPAELQASLRASPLDVLKIYLFEYPGKREMIVPGKLFLGMIGLSVFGLIYQAITTHQYFVRNLMMFTVSLAAPMSWFILAKGHSYTQTHINFVLWYLGFMPALIYVASSSLRITISDMFGLLIRRTDD
jgi:uncharacterized membrane protein YqaE (UPF0057 family)